MPITVRDYTWRETDSEVVLVLPLKGVSPSRADILTTDRYIKVTYPPYLFEVYLRGAVVEEKCVVRVGDGSVEFRLVKREPGVWGGLVDIEAARDKKLMSGRRAEAVEAVGKGEVERAEARAVKKREEERFAVREQMRLEQEQRERIEGEKQEERDRANKELERWKEKKEEERNKRVEVKKVAEKKNKKQVNQTKTQSSEIWDKGGVVPKKAPPPPREGGSIRVQFTPRVFPTAARESKEGEEQEWLAKQAAARRITQPVRDKEGDVNERNPEFLKDRGIAFFKAKNYEAAINVFSEASSLNPALPQLFSNRAACYLATDNTASCLSDCCRALELYYPAVSSNQVARAKVLARRGLAYARRGEIELAVQDYEAAVELLPNDQSLREDLSQLKSSLLNS